MASDGGSKTSSPSSQSLTVSSSPLMAVQFEPPLKETFRALSQGAEDKRLIVADVLEEHELPVIDLRDLNQGQMERNRCIERIVKASSEWGFFQVVNHGIPEEVLEKLMSEERTLFRQPFHKKAEQKILSMSVNSYRWGNTKATTLKQLSWSEAFHIALTDISRMDPSKNLRWTIERFATAASGLAQRLTEHLAQNLGVSSSYFGQNCPPSSCYLRLNRYPPCPFPSKVFGLVPHTDSDFLTIVAQDQAGGLQLMKDGRWFSVKPRSKALIVNIGDLFQALSNGVYKSVKHRVVAQKDERMSIAYFYCPMNETVIQTCIHPAIYRKFSFWEYRQQIQNDVNETGDKVGLSRFLL